MILLDPEIWKKSWGKHILQISTLFDVTWTLDVTKATNLLKSLKSKIIKLKWKQNFKLRFKANLYFINNGLKFSSNGKKKIFYVNFTTLSNVRIWYNEVILKKWIKFETVENVSSNMPFEMLEFILMQSLYAFCHWEDIFN